MNTLKLILFIYATIGVINGIMLSIYYYKESKKHLKFFFLASLILVLSIRIGKSIYYYYTQDINFNILQIGLSACIFIGPLIYLYAKASSNNTYRWSYSDIILLFFLFFLILIVGILFPYMHHVRLWNDVFIYFIYGIWLLFLSIGVYLKRCLLFDGFTQYRNLVFQEKLDFWLFLSLIFISGAYQFALYIDGFTYLWSAIIFTTIFYVLLYKLISTSDRTKNKKPNAPSENIKFIVQKIQDDQLFLNPKLRIDDLSTLLSMSKHDLSKEINASYEGGFANLINSFRVDYAKSLLSSRTDLSLEGIGYEAGFNSKSTFFTTFKKITGYTPSKYLSQVNDSGSIL